LKKYIHLVTILVFFSIKSQCFNYATDKSAESTVALGGKLEGSRSPTRQQFSTTKIPFPPYFNVIQCEQGRAIIDSQFKTTHEYIYGHNERLENTRDASVMPGLDQSISYDTSLPPTRILMSGGGHAAEQVKKFIFKSRRTQGDEDTESGDSGEHLEILIPEVRREFV
jgi:hypothetical protein